MTAGEFLKWLFLVFVGLFIVWVFTGGPSRNTSRGGTFIAPKINFFGTDWLTYNKNGSPITSSEDGNINQNIKTDLEKAQELAGKSIYTNKISLEPGYASSNEVDREYLEIRTSENNTEKISITGWTLESSITGEKITIGKGTYLPYTSKINPEENVFLFPGERAYIITGRSPIGSSFKTNICAGYFEQFQDFVPSINTSCPRPEKEKDFITTGPNRLNDACIDYVERIPQCQIVTRALPLDMQYECSSFITNKINYNTCVENHKNEVGFYGNEWRLYLNRDKELWKERRETIKLIDINGKLVDTITY